MHVTVHFPTTKCDKPQFLNSAEYQSAIYISFPLQCLDLHSNITVQYIVDYNLHLWFYSQKALKNKPVPIIENKIGK